jgi:hypothetical protein
LEKDKKKVSETKSRKKQNKKKGQRKLGKNVKHSAIMGRNRRKRKYGKLRNNQRNKKQKHINNKK